MTTEIALRRIALIGFGEAGSILGEDLAKRGLETCAYDILFDEEATRVPLTARAQAARVRLAASLAEACRGADLVISAVTASAAMQVAGAAARALGPGQLFLDINSVSPAAKQRNAQLVESAGAHYVEAAVMAAVPPQRLAVPMLLGGPQAHGLAAALRALGMNATAVAEEIGVASAIKMCRSIVIKGLEALTVECLLAARRLGAEEQVLASLERTFPQMGWARELPDYLVSRVAEHGRRRAAEMHEVARTLGEAGIEPLMASAAAQRQERLIEQMAAAGVRYEAGKPFSWRALADAIGARPAPESGAAA